MTANDLRMFWLLFGVHGPTMSMEAIRQEFFPSITLKTLTNKAAAGANGGRVRHAGCGGLVGWAAAGGVSTTLPRACSSRFPRTTGQYRT